MVFVSFILWIYRWTLPGEFAGALSTIGGKRESPRECVCFSEGCKGLWVPNCGILQTCHKMKICGKIAISRFMFPRKIHFIGYWDQLFNHGGRILYQRIKLLSRFRIAIGIKRRVLDNFLNISSRYLFTQITEFYFFIYWLCFI